MWNHCINILDICSHLRLDTGMFSIALIHLMQGIPEHQLENIGLLVVSTSCARLDTIGQEDHQHVLSFDSRNAGKTIKRSHSIQRSVLFQQRGIAASGTAALASLCGP